MCIIIRWKNCTAIKISENTATWHDTDETHQLNGWRKVDTKYYIFYYSIYIKLKTCKHALEFNTGSVREEAGHRDGKGA